MKKYLLLKIICILWLVAAFALANYRYQNTIDTLKFEINLLEEQIVEEKQILQERLNIKEGKISIYKDLYGDLLISYEKMFEKSQ